MSPDPLFGDPWRIARQGLDLQQSTVPGAGKKRSQGLLQMPSILSPFEDPLLQDLFLGRARCYAAFPIDSVWFSSLLAASFLPSVLAGLEVS